MAVRPCVDVTLLSKMCDLLCLQFSKIISVFNGIGCSAVTLNISLFIFSFSSCALYIIFLTTHALKSFSVGFIEGMLLVMECSV